MAEREQPSPNEKLEYIELSRLYDIVLDVYNKHAPNSMPGAPNPSPEVVKITPGMPDGVTERVTLYKKLAGDTCLLYVDRTLAQQNTETRLRYSFIASSVLHDGKGIIRASRWAQERQQPPGAYYGVTPIEEGGLLTLEMSPYEVQVTTDAWPISPDDAAYLRQILANWDRE